MQKITLQINGFGRLQPDTFDWEPAAQNDVRLMRYPDINKNLIAFVYAGDIWSVDAERWRSAPTDLTCRTGTFSKDFARWKMDRIFGRILRKSADFCDAS